MVGNPSGGNNMPAPADWQGWLRWAESTDWSQSTDWSDWRSWLQEAATTDWASGPWPEAPWEPDAPWEPAPDREAYDGGIPLSLQAFAEDEPGDAIRDHLTAIWPAYRRWWRSGAGTRPSTAEAGERLAEHMPELVPAWRQLTAMLDDPDAGAALALWNPPPFLTGCSQAAVLPGGPALVRNYDWDYRLFEGLVARTAYTGRPVLGMIDCLWGLLDGINGAGLAVSLTFGGRPQVGEGFGIPLVIRYVLEVATTAAEAVQVLRRIPVHMSYNVTVLDRTGQYATVYLAPDRPARVSDVAVATNHQGEVEWAPYVAAIRSVERQQRLTELLADGTGADGIVSACLRSPLYATRFGEGFGTLYTAEYRPAEGVAVYRWPGQEWEQSLTQIQPGPVRVRLGDR